MRGNGRTQGPARGRRAIAAIAVAVLICPAIAAAAEPSGGGTVALLGAVAQPGAYAIAPGERLSSLIERAGGYADNALLAGALLTRASQLEKQRAALLARIDRAEALALSRPGDAESKRRFFESLRRLAPAGRVPVRLSHPRLLKGSEHDLPMEDGDTLLIPSGTPGVAVTGAVRSPDPAVHPFASRAGYEEYLRLSGGFAPDADRDRVLLVKADGSVVRLARGIVRWNARRGRWEIPAFGDDRPRVDPGDRIAAPRKPTSGSWMRHPGELDGLREEIAAMTGVVVDPP